MSPCRQQVEPGSSGHSPYLPGTYSLAAGLLEASTVRSTLRMERSDLQP